MCVWGGNNNKGDESHMAGERSHAENKRGWGGGGVSCGFAGCGKPFGKDERDERLDFLFTAEQAGIFGHTGGEKCRSLQS